MTTVEEAKAVLSEHGCSVVEEDPFDHGVRLRCDGGQVVSVYGSGKVVVQGKNTEGLEEKFALAPTTVGQAMPTASSTPTEVFVVYGHNEEAKNEIERMLRRWKLNPIMLDQIPAEGLTLIEKLEKYIQVTPFAVVLATADDVYLSDPEDDTQKEFRARQNVVLELGMMLVHLRRENIAILLEDKVGMKKPSDIDGLEYLPFKDDVAAVGVKLAQMMTKRGYVIDIGNL
ncbi:TIR domain-containing protein [Candidatus Poriferisodalis multihospitum]|uniref:TIR domain-containing protein n=1 Tax=Candidatus Poriferisodalis multihospitum TaxID=2983191 RepID=UPI002396FECD|nr:TIR domain-containing protein [Candidatus Poriferisodalis multihospitum]MDE0318947.1 nucleotide-binding protein [Acidimicrobiaceae bacterium]